MRVTGLPCLARARRQSQNVSSRSKRATSGDKSPNPDDKEASTRPTPYDRARRAVKKIRQPISRRPSRAFVSVT